MKSDIHPQMYDVVFMDSTTGSQFITQSTIKTDEKVKIKGKEYYVIKVEISSASHPFYTGKQNLIDTAGRVDKFRAKMAKAKEVQEKSAKNVKNVDADDVEKIAKESAESSEEEVAA